MEALIKKRKKKKLFEKDKKDYIPEKPIKREKSVTPFNEVNRIQKN